MEIQLPKNLRIVKLPSKVEFTVFMIREELKSRKFLNKLDQVGFDTSACASDFSSLILGLAGFENHCDELYEWYLKLSEGYVEKFDLEDGKELSEQAFNFYLELVMEKRKGDKLR